MAIVSTACSIRSNRIVTSLGTGVARGARRAILLAHAMEIGRARASASTETAGTTSVGRKYGRGMNGNPGFTTGAPTVRPCSERDASLERSDFPICLRELNADVGPLQLHSGTRRIVAQHVVELALESVPLRLEPGVLDPKIAELRLQRPEVAVLSQDRGGGRSGSGWCLGLAVHGKSMLRDRPPNLRPGGRGVPTRLARRGTTGGGLGSKRDG